MNQNNRGYIACQNPQATKEQKAEWDRMVRDLKTRKQEEQNAKQQKHST
jgi:hypothetical protein